MKLLPQQLGIATQGVHLPGQSLAEGLENPDAPAKAAAVLAHSNCLARLGHDLIPQSPPPSSASPP